jgi:hypothetical protein
VKRVVYLVMVALVAMMILVPTAMAQTTEKVTKMEVTEEGIPKTGGPAVASILLPAGALLLGSGILAYAVLRRR